MSSLAAVAPVWIRCPDCGRILGEETGGLALVHHRRARALAVFVSCHGPGCRGSWTSSTYRGVVDRARGLKRLS